MHKGIILLTKAEEREDAIEQVKSFLADYENQVWDWYVIGGRWSGLLTGNTNDRDSYKDEGYPDDVLPLKQCLNKVKEYKGNKNEKIWEGWGKANDWAKEENDMMYGYCLTLLGNLYSECFSFESDVYNMEKGDFSIPEDVTNYWAVVVDIHN